MDLKPADLTIDFKFIQIVSQVKIRRLGDRSYLRLGLDSCLHAFLCQVVLGKQALSVLVTDYSEGEARAW